MRMIAWMTASAALLVVGAGARAEGPARSGVSPDHFDREVRPQDDLFRHVNGEWLKTIVIPADKARFGAFDELIDKAESDIRAIIEEVAASDASAGSEAQKIGDLFASFMDEERVEKLGLDPIRGDLEKVAAVNDTTALIALLAEFDRAGTSGIFGVAVSTDDKKSDESIINLYQGGIGLPDESYYREEKFAPIREAYVSHVAKMFGLAALPEPEESAETVMAVETRLAKNHWDRVKSRDDTLTYNKKDLRELASLTPGFDWSLYFEKLGARDIEAVIVRQPDFFEAAAKALADVPLEDWKTWLRWKVLNNHASYLSQAFVDEHFDFYGKTLSGAEENRPRWKRGVSVVQGALGEALGKLYVAKHFPPESKTRMRELVGNLIEAYRQSIQELDWMSPETKKQALAKLDKFTPKIGYPDKWRDYSKLQIDRDDLVGNVRRAEIFEAERQLAKLGKPVDRDEWFMTPQTVNAYYNPSFNEIVFPAAILQPPFFNPEADDAVNYGGIGAVIGHEIGHGFDDQGSKYDGDGNMKDWWTEADREEFEARAQKLIEQYNQFEPEQLPGQHVNGALTIGENIGDLGGMTIAHKAYRIALGDDESPVIEGMTGDQRFFFGWAQVWRIKFRDQELARRLATDPHSPGEFRCNGVVRNMPSFYEAFDVKEGDKLYLPPEERVKIW